ncbi:hypothetical protein EDB81DRAFT_812747 [Dactylonectria macrodidyma]|uniref:F-box domain-containing protein n=1 Tax=Dactylonectria macrodidyma TaxID=307937 RepID=A0A9P9IMB2_9HYPO|nr:hypothetical protein EDB81DRAFT_812747 [Dactylonectria macrodidyma]
MARLSIFSLPLELRLTIIDKLAFPDTANLRATCRSFASLIPAQSSHYLDLLAVEDSAWAVKRGCLTCVYCARMRPASAFTEQEKSKKTARAVQFRCCYSCALAYDATGVVLRDRCTPVNHTRTRFSNDKTKVHVDHIERAICKWCHNSFNRWGSRYADREVCTRCFHDNPTELAVHESIRYNKDLIRMEHKYFQSRHGQRTLGVICNGDEDLTDIRDDEDWLYNLEWDWAPPTVFPVWRGGGRGVVVRKQEEAKNLYFEVQLPQLWTAEYQVQLASLRRIV